MKQHELAFPRGEISFELPDSWVFETEQPDMFMYYDPRDGSGTLRLHVITAEDKTLQKAPAEKLEKHFEKHYMERAREESGKFNKLNNGNLLLSYSKKAEEGGQEISLNYWELGKIAVPNIFNFIFSFTILESQQNDDVIVSEIAMIEKTIKSANVTLI